MSQDQRFARELLPAPAQLIDRRVIAAVDAVAAGDDGAVRQALTLPGSIPAGLLDRVLAVAVRVALEHRLTDGVDAAVLGDVLSDAETFCSTKGLPFDDTLMTVVLTGAFGLAPTREELSAAAEQDDEQARLLLRRTDSAGDLAWHAVVLLATVCPRRTDAVWVLGQTWAEIMRADGHDG